MSATDEKMLAVLTARVDDEISRAIEKHAVELEVATGTRVSRGEVVRVLLRAGIVAMSTGAKGSRE